MLPREIGARWQQNGLRLLLGRLGAARLAPVEEHAAPSPLDPARWPRPSRRWASATLIALDRNPGNLFSTAADAGIAFVGRHEQPAPLGQAVHLERPRQGFTSQTWTTRSRAQTGSFLVRS